MQAIGSIGVIVFLCLATALALPGVAPVAHAETGLLAADGHRPGLTPAVMDLLSNLVTTPSLAPMLERVLPGVVSIAVEGSDASDEAGPPDVPFLEQFLDLPEMPFWLEDRFQATASGVIIDADRGIVLTNVHVISNADTITVRLKDGRETAARVLGVDPDTDIAVLSVPIGDLTAVRIGRSDTLRVGDHVDAIGTAFGLEQTVTSGIVSALGRDSLGIEGYEDFIQVDASINPGHSGGALVNLRGELIGINTAILEPTAGSVGIGFAIPVDMAMTVAGHLIAHGRMERGIIGVLVQDLTGPLADALGVTGRAGVLVSDILPGSPAQKNGLLAGDVIVALDGKPVDSPADLRNRVGLLLTGTRVTLNLLRDGAERQIAVVLEPPTPPVPYQTAAPVNSGMPMVPRLEGMTLSDLPATDAGPSGVRVDLVAPDRSSAPGGLWSGDIILSVNGIPTPTITDLARQTAAAQGPMLVRVMREGRAIFLVVG